MKKNCWKMLFATLLSTRLLAQQATNPAVPTPIATPAAAPAVTNATPSTAANTNAPAAKSRNKKAAKRKLAKPAAVKKKDAAAELRTVPLVAGRASIIDSNVNERGRAGLRGGVSGQVTEAQPLSVHRGISARRTSIEAH